MPSILPLEIEEMILDILGDDDEGHSALKTCSLVCQAFLHICRKHIFESIFLHDISSSAFERLLRETPEIADYIRNLDLDFAFRDSDLAHPSIQELLKRISRLEFLRVQPRTTPRLDWSNNPFRPLLLHLLYLPTLTHFKYLDIGLYMTVAAENTFPATLPEHSIQLNELVAQIGIPIAIMKRPDGKPIIDFGSLSKITVDIKDRNEGEASQELFRLCHVLTNVHITFWEPHSNARPSLADMLRPSMQTLKHIVVDVHDDLDVGVDPLFGIPSELEDMRNKNIIETIGISVTDVNWRGEGNHWECDWGRLDEVLTALGWFSLKRVPLSIRIIRFSRSANELVQLDVTMRKSFMRQFPRLSSSNSVLFDFKVNEVHE